MPAQLAYLLKKFPRLSETFILNELLGQEELGRAVHVFSRRDPDPEPRHPAIRRLRAPVEYLPHIRGLDPWSPVFGRRASRDVLPRLEWLVRQWPDWDHPRLPSLLSEALYLLERTRRLGIRHLHVHFATDAAVVAMLLRELGGPTYSFTAHAKDIYREGVNFPLLDRMIRCSEFVVTVCRANVQYLAGRLSTNALGRVRCLYNGIDVTGFAPPEHDGPPRDENHILSVGRLVEKKGFPLLLEALECLHARGVDFRTTLVGDGELRTEIEARIAGAGLTEKVRLTGAIDQAEVRRLMARATIFCLPCRVGGDGNRDALPTVLIEALAAGLPAISTPVSGIPEILDWGRAGVLVPQDDPRTTADALEKLLADRTARQRLSAAGRRRALEQFDLRRSAATLYGWFDEISPEAESRCVRSA